MRFKTFVLCTSSALVLAATPALAQETDEPQSQAQEIPARDEAGSLPTDAAESEG
jgi:hypothetical protein